MIESVMVAGDVLSKVIRYELNRETAGRVTIEVHEVIATPGQPEPAHKYVAYPSLIVGAIKQEYVVAGDSEEEVLIKCLEKLKEVQCFRDVIESVAPEVKVTEEVKLHVLAVLKARKAPTGFVLNQNFLLHQVTAELNPVQKDQLESALHQLIDEGVLTPERALTEQGCKQLYS